AVTPQQRLVVCFEEDNRHVISAPDQLISDPGKHPEKFSRPYIDHKRGSIYLARLGAEFYKSGDQLDREVIDREVAEILKRLQRRRHSRPAQPGYYDNRDRHTNPRRPALRFSKDRSSKDRSSKDDPLKTVPLKTRSGPRPFVSMRLGLNQSEVP